jgi:tRNA(Ile2) C34 agmatinyltransferase TiaS
MRRSRLFPRERRDIVTDRPVTGVLFLATREIDTHACPFCGWHKSQAVGRTGVTGELTGFRCSKCERMWNEVVTPPVAEREGAQPSERKAVS